MEPKRASAGGNIPLTQLGSALQEAVNRALGTHNPLINKEIFVGFIEDLPLNTAELASKIATEVGAETKISVQPVVGSVGVAQVQVQARTTAATLPLNHKIIGLKFQPQK